MTENDLKTLRGDSDGLLTYEYLANHIGECGPDEINALIDNMMHVDLSGQFMASAARYLNAIDPEGYAPAIRELVAGAGAEGIMLSTITDALRAKFKDFKVRDLGYSQMRQYMASVGDYELEKSGRNFRVRLSQ